MMVYRPTGMSVGGSGPARWTAAWMPALLGLAVAAAGGITAAEAHYENSHQYLEVTMDILDYEVGEYDEFNVIRVELEIDNQEEFDIWDARFFLGGISGAGDSFSASSEFSTASGALIRDTYDIDASDSDCAESLPNLAAGSSGRISTCYVVGKTFGPDGLRLFQLNTDSNNPSSVPPYDPHHTDREGFRVNQFPTFCSIGPEHGHQCSGRTQVVPFHTDSSYCSLYGSYCDSKNVQDVGSLPRPEPEQEPEQEPEPQAPAVLLYTLYNSNTGTLTLVFDRLVVAHDPDGISLIHDIAAYIEEGAAPGLGGAELSTVDNKRQSVVLAFALTEEMRQQVSESLEAHGDLALLVRPGAIYSADSFADVTVHLEAGALLVGDLMVVR